MVPVSVVIITKDEAEIIERSITMAKLITDDIVVVDNGSTDNTAQIATDNGCRVLHRSWDGYGANKNKGISNAKYNWILSLDADEIIDHQLIAAICQLNFDNEHIAYNIRFKTYFGSKLICFGAWGRDHHVRLFNREMVKWSELPVHETLTFPEDIQIKTLGGAIHHYSVKDADECRDKAMHYATLSAKKYFTAGKKSNFIKLYISAIFNFLRNYVLYLGFLDGREGWCVAKNSALHTWLKYHYLNKLEQGVLTKVYSRDNIVYMYPADRVNVNASAGN